MPDNNGQRDSAADCGIPNECTRVVPTWLVAVDNGPTVVMFLLGAALLRPISWSLSIAFLAYCALAIVLFWARICPHCHHFDTRACPCGYGVVAAAFFKRKVGLDFRKVFRRNIGLMFPCWFVPLGAGIYLLWVRFSSAALGLFLAFCIVAFLLIPAISRFVGCRDCDVRDQCPWMAKKAVP